MGFWGIEVKPGKPIPYHADNVQGKLHVTQATLGTGSSVEKSILQCSSGHKSAVFLCSLLPNKIESCPLNLEFDDDDLVAFSVIGPRSIHLSGYFVADDGDDLRDDYEYDSFGEDVEGTETEESSEYDSEDGFDFIDGSDVDIYRSSSLPNSGVVIEEIVDEDKPDAGDDPAKQSKKKKQAARLKEKDNKSSQLPIVVGDETVPPNLESEHDVEESEDEDGFPISASQKSKFDNPKEEAETKEGHAPKKTDKTSKKGKQVDQSAGLKRKVESADDDVQRQDGKKKNKKDKLKKHGEGGSAHVAGSINEAIVTTPDEKHSEEVRTTLNTNNASEAKDGQQDGNLSNKELLVEKKNKKKKKKKAKESEGDATANEIATAVENKDLSTSEKKGKKNTEDIPSQVRSFPNGLVIEELSMGKPDGKRATPGKKVSVKYIGKLRKDGKIFDSNVGRAPFKFRLGVGQVIKGWEVGVNGMRIGDKRRITVPPSMGYGDKRAGTIPPNSWLVFDVELVNVDG
ncbi:PREDICTED: peptidyl-prolyl cis-trans isomerase FKBP53 [Lupinus angustifolius]|uniref:peptidyl-prolyl cis-trans isomerase FKBP53 n=1 Tax=Lupinus angustifolius TaxID=3871 RepID=UPI00092F52C0|nr:PREDICTED: peptidyl-prolyl cis-trans isomerase FKBP53 [Lupinus angustifolius]